MQSTTPSLNNEFKHVDEIDFTVTWDVLDSPQVTEQNPPECPNCGFVSPTSPCVFCGHETATANFTNGVAVFKTKKETDAKKENQTRVYCIDISGSMQGPRIDYVKAELKKELSAFVRSNPDDKVCLITFESDCHILGDGSKNEVLVGCECSFEKIEEIATKHKDLLPISQSIDYLRKKIDAIECVGRTASISALALATSFASFTGGEVLFYTDGMRNKGLPSAGNTERIIDKAIKTEKGKEVHISIFFFANCQAFIAEYSECAQKSNGKINPIHIGKDKKSGDAQIKRKCVAYDLKLKTKASDLIENKNGKDYEIALKQVSNNENLILKFKIPKETTAKTKVGQNIYAQAKVEYKDDRGAVYKAYILGTIKIVNTVDEEDVQLIVSNKLNMIAELIDKAKWEEAKKILDDLNNMDFRISNDANNFFKNAFNELMSFLEKAQQDSETKKDDIIALLNYMKSARKDGIKI